ncbi:MAG: polysaccharide biosynthesis tyrosine autokinase [Thermodesulfobacteriota bacterium]|nr:polysaccharide biosynthesis tyrosine autokinase [Thermodesulfobacteriota bacterium]
MSKLKKAMEKAKAARKVVAHDFVKEPEAAPQGLVITYSQTEIVHVSESTLKKNKIISLFHGKARADQLKILCAQVLDRMKQLGGNSLLVTSPDPGVGKTLTAINLAVSISQEVHYTVLLVDADLRAPSVHNCFGLDGERGLSDYLLNKAELPDLLVNPGIEDLVILPGGKPLPNSAELLGASRTESMVREMKARYPERFIIFDSPAVLPCADALVFSRLIDGILLVVEAEKTPEKDLKQAMELLKERNIIGTVLNKAKG